MSRDERIAAYIGEDMTRAERAAFERGIMDDPEGLAELVAQRCVDAGLRALLDPQTQRVEAAIMATIRSMSEDAAVEQVLADTVRLRRRRPVPGRPFFGWLAAARSRAWLRPLAAGLTLAAVFAAVCAAWLIFNHETKPDTQELADRGTRVVVPVKGIAWLTHGTGVVWTQTNDDLEIGAALSPGWLRLKSGAVEIEFAQGARMILEGPAELRLISAQETELRFGKLSAQVPPQAHGFSVNVAGTKVTDLGTAFGVNKPALGSPEVHVFTGEVEVTTSNAGPQRYLTQGEAVRVEHAGLADLPANRKEFITENELAQAEADELQQRYAAWKQASRTFATDPAMLTYFDFEGSQTNGDKLINQAATPDRGSDGSVLGANWSQGRWPGKGALAFESDDDRVQLGMPGRFQSLTFLAWVRVDELPALRNALAMMDTFKQGEVNWQIFNTGVMEFAVRKADNKPHWDGVRSPPVIGPEQLGQWVQLGAVYDGGAGTMSLFVNGRLVVSQPVESRVKMILSPLELGNWTAIVPPGQTLEKLRQKDPNYYVRELHGRMDEFAVLSRPLSTEEIQRQYEAGRPRLDFSNPNYALQTK
jgi:hypothetical protein